MCRSGHNSFHTRDARTHECARVLGGMASNALSAMLEFRRDVINVHGEGARGCLDLCMIVRLRGALACLAEEVGCACGVLLRPLPSAVLGVSVSGRRWLAVGLNRNLDRVCVYYACPSFGVRDWCVGSGVRGLRPVHRGSASPGLAVRVLACMRPRCDALCCLALSVRGLLQPSHTTSPRRWASYACAFVQTAGGLVACFNMICRRSAVTSW